MCGIAGFLGGGDRTNIEAMTRKLFHRGPDAEGFWEDASSHLWLGHRRLSILDLSDGLQPMVSSDKSLAVIFNGEIYNYKELRKELESAGHKFLTDHSDTETLIHGYREWGENLPSKLNGMWAFAIWDAQKKCLFASRDRFGKKPFYYFFHNGTFGFASELTALLCHPDAPQNLSETARVKFLAHALLPAPYTPIDGVWKLPAGHNLFVEPNKDPHIKRYWRYKIEPEETTCKESELADNLLELLELATRRRLVADVPLGLFLSGGIDSSAIAALAAKAIGGPQLNTFNIGFTEPSFDESQPAREMAGYLGCNHKTRQLDIDEAVDLLPQILSKLDEPQGDASLLPTWLLSRFAREHVTVALGGDGGDELFAGYDPFRALRMAKLYSNVVPRPVHKALRLLASILPVSHTNISFDFKVKRTLRGLSHPPQLWNPVWLGALEPDALRVLTESNLSTEEIYSEAIETWESCSSADPVDRTLQFFTEIYLQDGILAKADRASMLNSLEVRSPFLDIEVANFARKLPHRFKIRDQETKYLLKKSVRGLIPDSLIDRKKKGFGTPVGKWFREGKLSVNPPSASGKNFLAKHQSGQSDERLYLWCEMVWQDWISRRKENSR